jgi:hypothetical protein
MRVAVSFQDEELVLDVPEDGLVGEWHGPAGVGPEEAARLMREALENPRQYPPLRQAVVPGDQVVIALDPDVPSAATVVAAVFETLREAGVDADSVTVLVPPGGTPLAVESLPEGVVYATHDPDDRKRLAYLSSTGTGRRVYLNRLITDADFVLPVGRLGYDPVLGYRGPWSTLFPALSDREAVQSLRPPAGDDLPDPERPLPALEETAEVSWLLGSQFHIGVVPGVSGLVEVVAGLESAVRTEGSLAVDRAWSFAAGMRAEAVVAGIGRPGFPTRIEDLGEGLATAARLVRRGGKIVILSRADGPLGPAVRRLIDLDDPRAGLAALRGHEADPDYATARSLASALAWADVYLHSALDPDEVESLSMIPLARPEEARRLVSTSSSSLVVSRANLVRAQVAEDA